MSLTPARQTTWQLAVRASRSSAHRIEAIAIDTDLGFAGRWIAHRVDDPQTFHILLAFFQPDATI